MTDEPWAWALQNDRGEPVHGCIGRERTVKLTADDLGQGYMPVPVYLHPVGGKWFVRLSSQNAELRAERDRMLAALRAAAQVLAVQYQTRKANGGAGQQAFEKIRAILADCETGQ